MKLGQPDLFTKRVRKAPPAKERAVHIAIADMLSVKGALAEGWVWFHVPNGELRLGTTGALLQRMGTKAGVSDFILAGPPHGTLHALELKRRGLKPTEAQHAFMSQVIVAGGNAAWCDSYDEAIEILKRWGALSDRLHL